MIRILIFVAFCILSFSSFSQNVVHGTITNAQNEPIPYASIILEGSTKGTMTNTDGTYEIKNLENANYTLVFSTVGYATISRKIKLYDNQNLEVSVQLQTVTEGLNQVVITSNRTRETLDEVPSSVSVVSAKQLQNLSQISTNSADLLQEVPGIGLSTNRTSSTGQTLRGRNMLVLIDGIPQSTPLRSGGRDVNTIDPSTIERIEIIKGATAIYGNGADGGIVNYITKKTNAAKRFESITNLGAEGSLSSIDHSIGARLVQTFSGNVNKFGYVVSGSFRQTGVFKDADGIVTSPYYGLGETNQYSFFSKLNYQFTDRQHIELMYNYYSSNQNSNYVAQDGEYLETPTIGILGNDLGVDQGNRYNHNIQLTYDFEKIFYQTDFRLNLYEQDFKTVYGFTSSLYDPSLKLDGGQSMITSTKKGARFNLNTSYEYGEVEGNILYGMDILNDKTAQGLVDGRPWVPQMDMKNFAPYAQLKTLYKELVFKAGIRFENINIDVPDFTTLVRYRNDSEVPTSGGIAVNGGKIKYDATTFNTGLRYNKWSFFKPFLSFSQSFSIADLGRTLRSATANTVSQINSEAVIANNYETGFNSRFGNTRISSAYFISTSDFGSTYSETENGAFEILRQPEKVYGFEVTVDAKFASNLNIGGSVSYTEGKLDTQDNGNYDTYMNGDRIPPIKTVAYLAYDWENVFNARISYIYSGNRNHFSANEDMDYLYGQGPVNSFNLVNLTANYTLSTSTSLGLGIENLLNTDYYNLISQWAARDSDYIKANGTRFNVSLTVKL
ncbi:TonB-dependent receptor [Flavimarina sp. Hel_I_48]|uniref:TonB-dependent receptor n=1 Tax=Flavimarina sp. Hel_I_48 TaxID=1392488 RepID=UPI0004DF9B6C|nr:TonB-dependent receptor [Flavimarina sp. Hel_I_48]